MNTQIQIPSKQYTLLLKKITQVLFVTCIAFTANSYADDTEVFLKTNSYEGGKPNIVIMLDSSSSMNQNIKYYDNYDPDAEFTGNLKCDNAKIYVDTKNNPNTPGCNNTPTIDPSALRCRDIADFMMNVGSLNDRVHQWDEDSGTWGKFGVASNATAQTAPIDCLNDQGTHGDAQILTVIDGKVAIDKTVYAAKETTNPFITNSGAVDPDTLDVEAWSETEDTSLSWGDDKFVTFYTGHFLNYVDKNPTELVNTNGTELARTAMTEVITNFSGFNLGLARYNLGGNKTAAMWAPVVPLDDPGVKEALIENFINAMGNKDGTFLPGAGPGDAGYTTTEDNSFSGGQPMAAGQYEAYLYFRGEPPHGGGLKGANGTNLDAAPQPPDVAYTSPIPLAIDGDGNYKSPITAENGSCQGNYILYLTASGASADSTEPQINKAIGWTPEGVEEQLEADQGKCGQGNDKCLDDLAKFMYEHDLRNDIQNGEDENGDPVIQNVVTYGISINNSAPDLDEAAVVGGGRFRKAENPGAIAAVLAEILTEIIGKNSTFVAPAISINNFNRLENNQELYYSLFTPTENAVWDGNLKKYKIKRGIIKDANDNPAVDPTTGAFYDTALSYWTDPNDAALAELGGFDGNESGLGGFASRLLLDRNVYTNTDSSVGELNLILGSSDDTRMLETNSLITQEITGVNNATDEENMALTDAEKEELQKTVIKWGRGETVAEDDVSLTPISTKFIGDLLHTTPTIVNYNSGTLADRDVDQAIFFGTNNGFIHGVDVDPFDAPAQMEHFAFAPYETLERLYEFYNNPETIEKAYGIDGPIRAWLDESKVQGDPANNSLVDAGEGEQAFIYATQRRGGRNIYALDVTNYDAPELAWKIRGGAKNDDGTPVDPADVFNELGQTWSAVNHASIANSDPDGEPLDVVIFAGGYDSDTQDTGSSPTADPAADSATMGRAIYIVNAKTGEYIWHASPSDPDYSEMTYAIPSEVGIFDIIGGDGLVDRMYVGDLGGQIWRFDIGSYTEGTNSIDVTGGVIAKLNQSSAGDVTSGLTNRRFFSPPSVSIVDNTTYGNYVSLALGSGYRAHPLDERINDKFYMIKDEHVDTVPDYDNIDIIYDDSETGDANVQMLNVSPGSPQVSSTLLAGYKGWALDFTDPGEKVINPALTADNKIFFTTYVPESITSTTISCVPNAQLGTSRLYAVSLFKGGSTGSFNDFEMSVDSDGNVTITDLDGNVIIEFSEDDNFDIVTNEDGSVEVVNAETGAVVQVIQEADGSNGLYEELTDKGISAEVVLHQEQVNLSDPNDPTATPVFDNLVTLIVGKETLNPNIIVAPVRTYWHRID